MLDPASIVSITPPRVAPDHQIVCAQEMIPRVALVSDVDELLVVVPIDAPTTIEARFYVVPFWSSLKALHELDI
jgi:hypothetical protein